MKLAIIRGSIIPFDMHHKPKSFHATSSHLEYIWELLPKTQAASSSKYDLAKASQNVLLSSTVTAFSHHSTSSGLLFSMPPSLYADHHVL
jgi:hypothetical protein